MAQLNRKTSMWALIGRAVLTLAGIYLAGVLLNGALSSGDISGVLDKAGWFYVAGITAVLVSGLFLLRVALRREWSGLAAKRVMMGIAALFVLAFLFIEWVPIVRRDNSVDADKLLEQSRETLKRVDSEMERIRSEMHEIASVPNLEAKAKQPNTIYTKTVEGGLTLENLMTVGSKGETNPNSQESASSVFMSWDISVSVSNEGEYSGNFAYRCSSKELTSELGERSGVEVRFVGDLAKWRETVTPNSMSSWDSNQMWEDVGRPTVLAFKAEVRTSEKPMDDETEFLELEDVKRFNKPHNTPEIKAFLATLRYGESGEFDGWHYLKVDLSAPKK